MRRFVLGLTVAVGLNGMSMVNLGQAADWTRFRGPNGSGVSPDTQPLPAKFSATENLKWKVPLPGPGSSSPIVVGDKVFVTCWSGYGVERGSPGEQANLRRHLICIDRKTGSTVWQKDVEPFLPEDVYRGMFAEHGYASHTPVSDGQRVYVFFGKTGVLAFDLDGKQLWHAKVGTESDPRDWGSASSPILYKNLVIVTASAESQAIVGLDKDTGKEVWRQEAEGFGSTWGTPVLVKASDTVTDLVLGVPNEIWGINPETGKLRWFCPAMNADSYCSSVVVDGDTVIGVEGRGGGSIAVRAGGQGDVSKSHVVWQGRDNNRIGTPLIHDGRVYFISDKIANCIEAKTGKSVYKSRLTGGSTEAGGGRRGPNAGGAGGPAGGVPGAPAPGGGRPGGGRPGGGFGGPGGGFGGGFGGGMGNQDYASPVAADGKLYFTSRGGDIYVLKLGDKFEQLSVNRVTDQREDFSATPAVSDGELFIRSSKHLYCVGQK